MTTQPPAIKRPYLDLNECIARYPRLAAKLTWAGYSLTEAGAAIRDYRLGMTGSSEAIDYTGGTRRAIEHAIRFRHYAQRYQDPQSHSRRQIARIAAEHRISKRDARAREETRT